MDEQESVKGSWPISPCSLEPRACKLIILKTCRHHVRDLGCFMPEESLSSMQLSFTGQFVQVQYVIALGRDDAQELMDCRLEAVGNAKFRVVNNAMQHHVYVIEAEVEPAAGQIQTSSVECLGDALPSHAGKFTFLLPADIPNTFNINFKFKSLGSINNWSSYGDDLIDEMKTYVITHYSPKSLYHYWDGHSLPTVELPFAKKKPMGILVTPEVQRIIQYFQVLVENGAVDCFKRDQHRLLQHTSSSDVRLKDLILAIQLEESLLLYQMGNLEECKRVGEDVCAQAQKFNSPNYNAIAGKAKSVLSGAYKQEKDFPKAEEMLESSTELLESVVPGEETAINRTCVAALYSEKAAVMGITNLEKKKMKRAMKNALIHYGHQLDQNLNRNARGPRRTLIRSMFYRLGASRGKATNMQIPVSDKNMSVVETYVQDFSRRFLGGCPMRDRALFYNALGDFCARKGEYEQGIRLVFNASRIAEDLQLQEDIRGSRDRLQQLNLLRQAGGGSGLLSFEMSEGRMAINEPFQEPGYEILEGYLAELTHV